MLLLLLALPLLSARSVEAKVKKIPDSYGPAKLTNAPHYEGVWLTQDGKQRFFTETGKLIKKSWFYHENKLYLSNKSGNQVNGFVSYRGNTYYMKKNGVMLTGWLKKTYFFHTDTGAMLQNGAYKIKGSIYYFQNGKKQTGLQTIKGKDYFFLSSGKLAQKRWVTQNGKTYRASSTGSLLKDCWLTVSGKKYYLGSDGARLTGLQAIGGELYVFTDDGVLLEEGEEEEEGENPSINPSAPMVALTFDDGPSIYTPTLLSALQKNGARATFFMMGDRVLTYPSAVQQMVQAGCELGNHSMTHTAMTTLSLSAVKEEFSQTSQNIYKACGQYPTVARLPYGDGYNNSSILSAVGLPSIYWSIDTEDWKNTGNSQATVDAVLNQVQSGDIILMHDLYAATVNAAQVLIPALKERGFQLVTVSELAKYKGNTTLQTGRTYFQFR